MMDRPILIFAFSLVVLWLAAYAGTYVARTAVTKLNDAELMDLTIVVTAALTLLGLIIGFTFSMAITRYNQRKDLEAAEANAIGTETLRLGLMPAQEAAGIRGLLKLYLEKRVAAYAELDERREAGLRESTARVQSELWLAVQDYAISRPTPIAALVVNGMNDVLNSQAYTQAAWWNRIPVAAWVLMAVIAVICSFLVGYTVHKPEARPRRVFVLPLIVAFSFLLIADIDSPHGGVIRIHPLNLESLHGSLDGIATEK
jgi:hypothetical protein